MTERQWDILNAVGAVAAVVGLAAAAWRDWHEARQARIRAEIEAIDLEKRREKSGQERAEEPEQWVEI